MFEADSILARDDSQTTVDIYEEPIALQIILKSINLLWLCLCVTPNVFLIWILIRRGLTQFNFYLVIVYWSTANILQMIYSVYHTAVPQEYILEPTVNIFFAINCVVSQQPMVFAVQITFDKFINSERICRQNMRSSLISASINLIVVITLILLDVFKMIIISIAFVSIGSLVLVIFITRLVFFCIRGSEEKNYNLRLAMSSVCIACNYLFVIYVIIDNLAGISVPVMMRCVTFVIYANGLVNFLLLYLYDEDIRSICKQVFMKCGRKRSNSEETVPKSISTCEELKISSSESSSIDKDTCKSVYDGQENKAYES